MSHPAESVLSAKTSEIARSPSLISPDGRTLRNAATPFIIGAISGMTASVCIQPVDVVKVRMQLTNQSSTVAAQSPFKTARVIVAKGGALALYAGLSAALLRQVVYGTSRLGLFFTFEDMLKTRAAGQSRSVTFTERALASLAAGGLGAMIGNPTEVALIRMQADGIKAKAQRANYSSVFDALGRIVREENVLALWRGSSVTVIRAMSTNFGQLAFFSEAKHQLQKIDGISGQTQTLAAASIAGFFAAFFSLPFDFMKTRLQQQSQVHGHALQYNGMKDCFLQVVRVEGPMRFYHGFWTYFMRIAPHSMISLVVADTLAKHVL